MCPSNTNHLDAYACSFPCCVYMYIVLFCFAFNCTAVAGSGKVALVNLNRLTTQVGILLLQLTILKLGQSVFV